MEDFAGGNEEKWRLLNDADENDNSDADTKKDSSWLKYNLKLLIGVLAVVALVILGIVVGAVSNKHSHSKLNRLARNEFPYAKIRLPTDLKPLRYRIYLHPNLTTFDVFGSTRILIKCLTATKKVILHFKGHTISDIRLLKGSYLDSPIKVEDVLVDNRYRVNAEKELLMVESPKILEEGKNYTLIVRYNGTLSETLQGFYRSSYKTNSGETRYIATTHFESSAARTAFPCFDEPAMKAQFRIIIVKSKKHSATSNMPILQTKTRKDGLDVVHFEESIRMSTYVVAFVVHDFKTISTFSKRGIKISIIAPADQISQAEFARETAPKVLDFYENFFHILFPLKKLDLIAIPDFSAGAMENWGLITYRMTSLLYDVKESSDSNKQWVAIVIAHEFAHQWFGNLVTMEWWNDLWLNEGFASFMEYLCVDDIFPAWQMMDQFVTSHVQRSLVSDSHSDSHPISVPVKDPKEVNSIFDAISYDKGSAVIRMMKDYLGESAFDTGLKNYLNKHKFGNARSDDLWMSLSKATNSGVDVKSLMDTWTLQMGYPVVTLSKESSTCFATQKHFLTSLSGKPTLTSPFQYKWDIPLTYKTPSKSGTLMFNRTQAKQEVPCPKDGEWIKFNVDNKGFFRSNYDKQNWKLLGEQLKNSHEKFSSSDRANMIDDAFELARTGMIPYDVALDLTQYFNKEQNYAPWYTLMESLGYISSMLEGRPGYSVYEKYLLKIIQPMIKKLGWQDEGSHLEKYLRALILGTAVKHNDTVAVKKALLLFNDFKTKDTPIAANLKGAIYLAGVKYGTIDNWNFLWKRRQSTKVPTEKRKIMFALTDTQDPAILKKYLSLSLNSSSIRSQDSATVIIGVAANKAGFKMAWDFTIKRWSTLYERYSRSQFQLQTLIHGVFARGKTLANKNQVIEFFKTHDAGTGKRAVSQAIESIQNHIDWLERYEKSVVDWLKKQL